MRGIQLPVSVAGSMVPRYVWQLLVKNHNIAKNLTAIKAREKISTDLGSLEF
jgi:hypothetical protein